MNDLPRGVVSSRFVGLMIGLALLGGFVVVNLNSGPRTLTPKANNVPKPIVEDDKLQQARDALRKEPDTSACRDAIKVLNTYLARPSGPAQVEMDPFSRTKFLSMLHGDSLELAEMSKPEFTPLDSHYLEACFFLRDVGRGLGLDTPKLLPRERAQLASAWVCRQVWLNERAGPSAPPLFVLRRGFGTLRERGFVLLELLRQFQLDVLLIGPPDGNGVKPFAVGVLLGEQLQLFDLKTGQAIVPAWTDLRSTPAARDQWAGAPPAADLAASEGCWGVPINALSVRMQFLQAQLKDTNPVHLHFDALAVENRFIKAEKLKGLPIRAWYAEGDSPTRLLANFLPPSEGGEDRSPAEQSRLAQYRTDLIPWSALPAEAASLPPGTEPGVLLRGLFMKPFIDFTEESTSPRNLVLRGQYGAASTRLTGLADQIRAVEIRAEKEPELLKSCLEWIAELRQTYGAFLQVSRQGNEDATRQARARFDQALNRGERGIFWMHLSTAAPLRAESQYLLALCKLEQAERRTLEAARAETDATAKDEARSTATSAAALWGTYLAKFGTLAHQPAPRTEHAKRLLERARELAK
jgi:hypothetical protein